MAWSMTICAALAGLALQAGAELPSARTRSLLSVVVTLALLVAALLCAGVSPSLLQPSRWDELGIGHRGGHRGDPRDRIALPRRRRVGRGDGPARRDAARRDRGAAGVLADARRRAALAGRRGDDAHDAVRRARDRGAARARRAARLAVRRCCSPPSCSPTASGPRRSRPRRSSSASSRSPLRRSCPRSTPSGRGSTCSRSPRTSPTSARRTTSGTTTTGRWNGRATAASCCASRPERPAYWKAEVLDDVRRARVGQHPAPVAESRPTGSSTSTTRTGSRRSDVRVSGLRSEQFVHGRPGLRGRLGKGRRARSAGAPT